MLAVLSPEKVPGFEDVPLAGDTIGHPVDGGTWRALAGPAGMDAAHVAKWEEAVHKAYGAERFQDAMRKANDTPYGLSAAIATRNPRYVHAFCRDIQSGTAKVNRTTTGNLINAPFGGLKHSSTSTFRESGRAGLEFYTQIKTVYRAG